ncbi:hypothetical protein [Pseudomonas sp. R84]|uniref:hypothetical protein n=1 Tax=Pseudomonas sp. R84 TaxID=1573712 RepID=UPI00135B5985|nr:hypothetical protein [Pseudomonas sp. R84]
MHPSTQDFVVNQALLVRLAKEDNIERDCFYNHSELELVSAFKGRAPNTRFFPSFPCAGGSGFFGAVPSEAVAFLTKARSFLDDWPSFPTEEPSVQVMLKMARYSHESVVSKISALLIDAQIVGARNYPDYDNAFVRLDDFENEESDWDGMGGQPADACTVQAVRLLLNQVRGLSISRPSLTLSNNGAVSVIWKDESRFATLKFKGSDQYSAIILVNRKPILTMNCFVRQLPQELQNFLTESFREDVTAHLSELPSGLR